MINIEKTNSFKSVIKKTDFGTLTTLIADVKISAQDSISFEGKTLLANYVYKKNGTYNLVYTVVDTEGNAESFVEDDGIFYSMTDRPIQNKELII